MCRNIRTLYNFEPPADKREITAAATQYVRKISGFTKPSKTNEIAFQIAITAIAEATEALIDNLQTSAPAKDRKIEAEKARQRAKLRFG